MSRRVFFAAVAVLSVIVFIALYGVLPVSAQSNNAPTFTDGDSTTRSVNENTSSFDNIGARVAATDADNDRLVYTLENARTSPFTIVRATGQLRVGQPLDYEAKSSYTVKVIVTDPEGATDTITVTVNVDNVEELGKRIHVVDPAPGPHSNNRYPGRPRRQHIQHHMAVGRFQFTNTAPTPTSAGMEQTPTHTLHNPAT